MLDESWRPTAAWLWSIGPLYKIITMATLCICLIFFVSNLVRSHVLRHDKEQCWEYRPHSRVWLQLPYMSMAAARWWVWTPLWGGLHRTRSFTSAWPTHVFSLVHRTKVKAGRTLTAAETKVFKMLHPHVLTNGASHRKAPKPCLHNSSDNDGHVMPSEVPCTPRVLCYDLQRLRILNRLSDHLVVWYHHPHVNQSEQKVVYKQSYLVRLHVLWHDKEQC